MHKLKSRIFLVLLSVAVFVFVVHKQAKEREVHRIKQAEGAVSLAATRLQPQVGTGGSSGQSSGEGGLNPEELNTFLLHWATDIDGEEQYYYGVRLGQKMDLESPEPGKK